MKGVSSGPVWVVGHSPRCTPDPIKVGPSPTKQASSQGSFSTDVRNLDGGPHAKDAGCDLRLQAKHIVCLAGHYLDGLLQGLEGGNVLDPGRLGGYAVAADPEAAAKAVPVDQFNDEFPVPLRAYGVLPQGNLNAVIAATARHGRGRYGNRGRHVGFLGGGWQGRLLANHYTKLDEVGPVTEVQSETSAATS